MRLSHRYIPARQLPDKAVSLLDTACARVAVSQHATPAELEDAQRRIEALATEAEIIGREERSASTCRSARRAIAKQRAEADAAEAAIKARFEVEKKLVDQVLDLRARLREAEQPGRCHATAAAATRARASHGGSRSVARTRRGQAAAAWPRRLRSHRHSRCRGRTHGIAGRTGRAADPTDRTAGRTRR